MHPPSAKPFREQAKELLLGAFGPPLELPTEAGPIYRWVLQRRRGGQARLYVTLDSPEMPNIAHVLISDPGAASVEPISSLTMRTMEEVHKLIERVRDQLDRSA